MGMSRKLADKNSVEDKHMFMLQFKISLDVACFYEDFIAAGQSDVYRICGNQSRGI